MWGIKLVKHYGYRTGRLRRFRNFDRSSKSNKLQDVFVRICGRHHSDNHETYAVNLVVVRIAFWFHDSTLAIGSGKPSNIARYDEP